MRVIAMQATSHQDTPIGRAPTLTLCTGPAYAVTVDLERGVVRLVRQEFWLELDISSVLFGKRTGYAPINKVEGSPGVTSADGYVDVARALVHVCQNTGEAFHETIDVTDALITCVFEARSWLL